MRLSVLLPTRNGARYLRECAGSVLASPRDDLELVVSDNASDAVRALDATRAARARALTTQIHDTYRFANARGETRSLRSLFSPGEPPTGSGDCAAPKLLAHAYRLGLRPIALAEFWWGAPS